MNHRVQKQKPQRTCNKTYANYTSFKPYLRSDFNKRCGYCDDRDVYSGGIRGYQIDHFKPHSIAKFRHLKEEYSNLVYSCPFCNRAKWDKWQEENGFIDPCSDEYEQHLQRDNKGKIVYISPQGEYIWKNLKLYLKRHELLWMIDKLQEQNDELDRYLSILGEGHELELEILREFRRIQQEIQRYTNLFYSEI